MAGRDCSTTPSESLIFACSGAADVGEVADLAARKLLKSGRGKMFCTVGIGGRVAPILETTRAASTILAIDGCSLDCTRRSLEEAGFPLCRHLRVTDLGMAKGRTEPSEENVSKVVRRAEELLR